MDIGQKGQMEGPGSERTEAGDIQGPKNLLGQMRASLAVMLLVTGIAHGHARTEMVVKECPLV